MKTELVKPKSALTKSDVHWALFDNFDGSKTMHHLLYDIEANRRYTGEVFIRNAFICNKKWHVLDENEQASPISECKALSELFENIACKKCLKFYNKLPV